MWSGCLFVSNATNLHIMTTQIHSGGDPLDFSLHELFAAVNAQGYRIAVRTTKRMPDPNSVASWSLRDLIAAGYHIFLAAELDGGASVGEERLQ